jgi:YD repeat-containing protein
VLHTLATPIAVELQSAAPLPQTSFSGPAKGPSSPMPTSTSSSPSTAAALPDGITYGYDALGRLVTATPPGGACSFRYDPSAGW